MRPSDGILAVIKEETRQAMLQHVGQTWTRDKHAEFMNSALKGIAKAAGIEDPEYTITVTMEEGSDEICTTISVPEDSPMGKLLTNLIEEV